MLREKLVEYTRTQKTLKVMLMRDLFPPLEVIQQQQLFLQQQQQLLNNATHSANRQITSSPRPKRTINIRRISSSANLTQPVISVSDSSASSASDPQTESGAC